MGTKNKFVMIILLFILEDLCTIHSETMIDETNRKDSNDFLKWKFPFRNKLEQTKEIMESTRESCIYEYRQQIKLPKRRHSLSTFCKQYCTETTDCEEQNEALACINPLYPTWPSSTLKFIRKFERTCYIRITDILRYEQAEKMCQKYGLELAVIDNIRLLEQLKNVHMFNTTCKFRCPEARGYYIGLKRQNDEFGPSSLKWIWSNNITWTQNETECHEDFSETSFANSTYLCYIGPDGEKKVTVWNIGEPSNRRHDIFRRGESCVEIVARPDKDGSIEQIGRLNDIPCNKPTLGAICQMTDTKPINASRLQYFANIIGFNETDNETHDLLDNLLSNFEKSILPNLNSIVAMTNALESILVLPSFTTEQATHVLNVVDQLVNATIQIQIENDSLKSVTNKLLNFIDLFPKKIQIDDENIISFNCENMNTSLVNINLNQNHNEIDDNKWFRIRSDNFNHEPNVIVELNQRALQKQTNADENYRIIETIFSNFYLFPSNDQINETVNGQLLGIPVSYQIANRILNSIDDNLVRIQIKTSKEMQIQNVVCVYWSFTQGNGSWISDDGCHFAGYINNYAQCYCNHLTHFALLMIPESEHAMENLGKIEEFILTFVTYIGIVLSIFGLVITLITYLLFRCSYTNRLHSSLFMLCLSILFVNCFYIPFHLTKPGRFQIGPINFCNIIGFLFHYVLLTSFMWMLIMATIQYMNFVRIFNSHVSYFFIKTSIIGWITPLIFPLTVIVIDRKQSYIGTNRCWINNESLLYITFVAPITLILLCNLVLFLFTLKSIFQRDPSMNTYQRNRSKLQIGASLCCFVSIGCTWLFGILVFIEPIFINQFIFCIFNSLQGFFIFLFHVFLSKPKRELWQTFFIQRGFHQRPVSSSGQTGLLTTSNSSAGNISTLARPVKFRFTPTSSTSDHQGISSISNPIYVDQPGNSVAGHDSLKSGRLSLAQPDFYDRTQKLKTVSSSHYA